VTAEPEVLTVKEAAALLRVCEDTVRRKAYRGELPGRKYRERQRWYRCQNNPEGMVDAEYADAAIAELEAKLATLDARRCEACEWYAGDAGFDNLCTKQEVMPDLLEMYIDCDCYDNPEEMAMREALAYWGSTNEYDFAPPPDFGCNRWEARP
jgi:excisionase family DNA binding protein